MMCEIPAQYGWICPKCGKVHAPWVPECDCEWCDNHHDSTTNTATPISGTCNNGDHAWILSEQTTAGTIYRCARCGAQKSIPPKN